MSLLTLSSSTEFSPMVDRKSPLYFVRISQQKLLREILHIFFNNIEIQRLNSKGLHKHWRHVEGVKSLCRVYKILIKWLIGPLIRFTYMLYKVIILYFKCVLKRKQRSNAPLTISYSLCNHWNVCVWACGLHGYVCICSCAFKSAMTYREPFWVALLPNIILFLLALLILWVIILKNKTKQKPCLHI